MRKLLGSYFVAVAVWGIACVANVCVRADTWGYFYARVFFDVLSVTSVTGTSNLLLQ